MNRIVFLAAVVFACLIPDSLRAARLLTVRIERNGQVLQTSFYEDDGAADPRTAWKYLGGDPLAVEANGKVVASEEDPMRAKLEGAIVIQMCHAKNVWIESRFENLTLVRVRSDRDRWFLPADEVMRTGLAAGLKMEDNPLPMDAREFWIRVLGIFAFVAMVLIVGLAIRRMQTKSSNQNGSDT